MTTLTTIGFWPWPVKSIGPGQPPGGTIDPPFADVSLLLGFDGSFADESSYNHTPTATSASISTTTVKYGTGSGSFPSDGSIVTYPDDDSFWFDADFTMECWVYPNSLAKTRRVLQQATTGQFSFFSNLNTDGTVSLTLSSDGTSFSTLATVQTVTTGQWQHLAWTRAGSTVRAFIDGQLDSQTLTFAGALHNSTAPVYVGGNTAAQGNGLNGFLDEVRITKGVALYTQSFTPPSSKFPRS
ncbi:Concanavalin A-like lectin/glucanases superfamily protein [Tistlia consotensis]|uniref:Concanavalin A-like lectin/glucanases superfamily protein n=1 Tax=Tistlia consotensis USBA 355 TaxID=560819 RepID=A0A1Y6C1N3_9PROT|nr:LamG domain-containing protein [Tistlia consotensis]SMF40729.1 Concanavalin A-like lectin/glucanases superfamily protein [Tistlia consotensis USBA 355]SNR74572.1 Concanavalin A-like lectin/glucanases superfamily protein [Tistlia consotensis]